MPLHLNPALTTPLSAAMPQSQPAKSDFWSLDGTHALLHAPRLKGEIDLHFPTRGLTALLLDGAAQVGWLMGVDVIPSGGCRALADTPWPIADVYIRGRDLVATYREPLEQPFNLQLYWRASESLGGAAALDLICSVQTPLWEAHPGVRIGSSLFDSVSAIAEGALVSAGGGQWSYVEATRRGDFEATSSSKSGGEFDGAFWQFGPQFMEKGVIRRLQLRGSFVPAGDVPSSCAALAEELAAEEPALTA